MLPEKCGVRRSEYEVRSAHNQQDAPTPGRPRHLPAKASQGRLWCLAAGSVEDRQTRQGSEGGVEGTWKGIGTDIRRILGRRLAIYCLVLAVSALIALSRIANCTAGRVPWLTVRPAVACSPSFHPHVAWACCRPFSLAVAPAAFWKAADKGEGGGRTGLGGLAGSRWKHWKRWKCRRQAGRQARAGPERWGAAGNRLLAGTLQARHGRRARAGAHESREPAHPGRARDLATPDCTWPLRWQLTCPSISSSRPLDRSAFVRPLPLCSIPSPCHGCSLSPAPDSRERFFDLSRPAARPLRTRSARMVLQNAARATQLRHAHPAAIGPPARPRSRVQQPAPAARSRPA